MLLRLSRKFKETPDATTFVFASDEPLTWEAGQYGIYRLEHPNVDDRKNRRFFTIASPPFQGSPQITTRISEKSSSFKKALNALEVGDQAELVKVGGDFVMSDTAAQHVMIAGGIGITPYHSIIRQLDHDGQAINITLLYANRTKEFVFKPVLDEIATRNPNFNIQYLVEPQRIDEAVITSAAKDLSNPIYWISGPEPMVEAFEEMITQMGIEKDRIKTDFFPGYQWPEA